MPDWQTLTSLGCVALAAAWVARRPAGLFRRDRPGCSSCGGCARADSANPEEAGGSTRVFIPIEAVKPLKRR